MEQVAPAAYNPHLQRVLKSFQSAAEASLSGPSRYMSAWGDPAKMSAAQLEEYRKALMSIAMKKAGVMVATSPPPQPPPTSCAPASAAPQSQTETPPEKPTTEPAASPYFTVSASSPPFPVQQMPLFLPMDTTRTDKADTVLEGETIACFIVGGEKRLCLPQILNTVLREFSLQQINSVCDDLHIFCSRCNPEQLDTLKLTGVLPPSAPSCGLITKTDAERLCNALLHGTPEKSRDPPSRNSFKVYHECFGKCKGIFSPELYSNPNAKCIECCDCHGLFCPQKFVCHSHKALENRTCHWGFDSANWRAYLLLAKDQEHKDMLQKALDHMKATYDYIARFKRRESPMVEEEGDGKKARYDENTTPLSSSAKSFDGSWGTAESAFRQQMSAFRLWSPGMLNSLKEGKIPHSQRDGLGRVLPSYLRQGPPVLLNPERVVPFADSKRYDRHFAPNVSLAPQPKSADDSSSEEEEEEEEEGLDDTCQLIGETLPVSNMSDLSSNSFLHSSSSTSSMMSLSPSNRAENRDLELDLSSDMDEASLKSASVTPTLKEPPSPVWRPLSPAEVVVDFSIERRQEVQLLKRALSGKVGEAEADQEKFIQQFLLLRQSQEERLVSAVQAKNHLQQELEMSQLAKRERLREASESKKVLRELEQYRSTKNPEILKLKKKYRSRTEKLKARLLQYDPIRGDMAHEIQVLRARLHSLGQSDLPDVKYSVLPVSVTTNGAPVANDADVLAAESELESVAITSATATAMATSANQNTAAVTETKMREMSSSSLVTPVSLSTSSCSLAMSELGKPLRLNGTRNGEILNGATKPITLSALLASGKLNPTKVASIDSSETTVEKHQGAISITS